MDLATTKAALDLFGAGERFVVVSTLETHGSSPRHSGAAMLVQVNGSTVGTVGGGALEARAIRTAVEVLATRASRVLDFELTSADAAGLGMICGGRGVLLVEHIDPDDHSRRDQYGALQELLAVGGTGWLVTAVADVSGSSGGGITVKQCLVGSGGRITGDQVLPEEVLRGLASAGGALDGHTAAGRSGVYVQPVGAAGTAYVFGAGHCGRSLVPLLGMVGFRTVVVDDRPDFASADRFPEADSLVVPESYSNALGALSIDEQSYLVIMTRGHLFDRALDPGAADQAGYIGMIGSKKKIAETFQALREPGFGEEDLARVHAPIGVEIGAETPRRSRSASRRRSSRSGAESKGRARTAGAAALRLHGSSKGDPPDYAEGGATTFARSATAASGRRLIHQRPAREPTIWATAKVAQVAGIKTYDRWASYRARNTSTTGTWMARNQRSDSLRV